MIDIPLNKKLLTGIVLQILVAIFMTVDAGVISNLATLITFTAFVHLLSGFLFNNLFAYCLGRFKNNAGIISGITGGGLFILTALISYGTVSMITIKNQELLGAAYLVFALIWLSTLGLFIKAQQNTSTNRISAAA